MHDGWGDVRALLPAWVGWLCLVPPLVIGVWTYLSSRACSWIALRQSATALGGSPAAERHWTDHARLWHAPRLAARANLGLFVILAAVMPAMHASPLHRVSTELCAVLGAVCAAVGGWLAGSSLELRVRPELTLRRLWQGTLTSCLVLYPHLIIAGVAAVFLPARFGSDTGWAFASVACLLAASAHGAGVSLALALGLMQPGSDRLQQAARRAAEATGQTPPRVYAMQLASANAFAFPARKSVVFSALAEELLDDEELTSVAVHELAHVAEPTWFQWARSAVAVALVAPLAAGRVLFQHFGYAACLGVLVHVLALSLLWRWISQRMEARADHAAHSAPSYARALERIYRANLVPAVMPASVGTHPHLYDRLQAAGASPDYPRPAPPPRALLAFVALWLSADVLVFMPYAVFGFGGDNPSESLLHLRLAVSSADAWELGELAYLRWQAGEPKAASTLFRAALDLAPGTPDYASGLTYTLSAQMRCDEAERVVAEQLSLPGLCAATRSRLENLSHAVASCRKVVEFSASRRSMPSAQPVLLPANTPDAL